MSFKNELNPMNETFIKSTAEKLEKKLEEAFELSLQLIDEVDASLDGGNGAFDMTEEEEKEEDYRKNTHDLIADALDRMNR